MKSGLPEALEHLILALRVLPGVGPRSSRRIALELLEHRREQAALLAEVLQEALAKVRRCDCCGNLAEQALCFICLDADRDAATICVVESPLALLAIEESGYRGSYHVLRGRLSPLDGLGPEEIGLPGLESRLGEAVQSGRPVSELILATSTTVEGEATAEFIARIGQRHGVTVTRLAQGLPLGGEPGQVDARTLSQAFSGRQQF